MLGWKIQGILLHLYILCDLSIKQEFDFGFPTTLDAFLDPCVKYFLFEVLLATNKYLMCFFK